MTTKTRPTLAQTRVLMQMWLDQRPRPHVAGQGSHTYDALVKRGWIVPTIMTYTFPNGQEAPMYMLSEAGFRAAQIGFAAAPFKGWE